MQAVKSQMKCSILLHFIRVYTVCKGKKLSINPLFSGNPKWVLLQAVKSQMKCSILLHFIRVYTVCKGKKNNVPFVFGKPQNGYFCNSEDPDEMQHNAAFHQGLHCL